MNYQNLYKLNGTWQLARANLHESLKVAGCIGHTFNQNWNNVPQTLQCPVRKTLTVNLRVRIAFLTAEKELILKSINVVLPKTYSGLIDEILDIHFHLQLSVLCVFSDTRTV